MNGAAGMEEMEMRTLSLAGKALGSALALTLLAGCGGDGANMTMTPAPAATATSTPSTASPNPAALTENFDGPSLNRNLWNVEGADFWVNNEQQVYLDDSRTISIRQGVDGATGGVLELRPIYAPGADTRTDRNADFVSGRIDSRSKYEFEHGKAEARIRMPAGAGFWPAFWLLGTGEWPATGEIDIMENVGDPTWVNSALHGPGYSGNTPFAKRYYFPAGVDVTQWHTYSVDWTASKISFAVDGNTYYEVSRADVEQKGQWSYDNAKFLILNFAVGGGYPHDVNKVDSPYYGLPQASVDKIKAGDVVLQVDWVKVTPE